MLRRLAVTLVIAGLSLFAFAAWEVVDRERHQALEQQQLEASLRAASVPQHARTDAPEARGARALASRREAWGRLEIPRLGFSVALDEGIDARTLRRAVGHVPGTPFPGEPGNVVLAGHRDSVFRSLRLVEEGDSVKLRTPDGEFTYVVTSLRVVEPERTDVLEPGASPEVTLVTCYPFYYLGPAPQRYIVKASVVPAPESARRNADALTAR
jgi:sortase A